jgi:hypothetical protein
MVYNGLNLKFASEMLRNNYEICFAAVKNTTEAYKFIGDELKNNYDICLLAIECGFLNVNKFTCFSRELQNDHGICLAAVKQKGTTLMHMNEDVRNSWEICFFAFEFIGDQLRNNRQFCYYVINRKKKTNSKCQAILRTIGKDLRLERELCLLTVKSYN